MRQITVLALALLVLAALVAAPAPASAQGVVHVAPTGADSAICGAAAQPCATIQQAVRRLTTGGGLSGEIRAAAGTYTGADPAGVVVIPTGVLTIRGGYSVDDWNTSDPAARPTIVDGQGARRGIFIAGGANPAACRITIAGLAVRNGLALAAPNSPAGGGILADNCNLTLQNLSVAGSRAVGSNNTGANTNTSYGTGGGVAVRGAPGAISSLAMQNVVLRDNQALGGNDTAPRGGLGVGGGLFAIFTTVSSTGFEATGNTARAGDAPGSEGVSGGQRADGLGGGVAIIDSPAFSLGGGRVAGNTAEGGDAGRLGGLGLGGGLFIERSTGRLAGVAVQENTARGGRASAGGAGLGGGLFMTDSAVTSDSARALANAARGADSSGGGNGGDGGGGGIYITTDGSTTARGTFTASNLLVAANEISGGSGGTSANVGGGVSCVGPGTAMTLDHATVAGNRITGPGGTGGPAIAIVGFGPQSPGCAATVRNSIIAGHAGAGGPVNFNPYGGPTLFQHTLWSNAANEPNIRNDSATNQAQEQNSISGDPQFAAPGAPSYDYHIGPGSAALDQALGSTLTTDFDGQRRPFGPAADVGVDERSTEAPLTRSSLFLPLVRR
jgi:hypothetical protein